jgi:hypothetical protein
MKSARLVVRDNPPVQNRVKLVTGNLTGQYWVKQRKSSCWIKFKVSMKSVRLVFGDDPTVQKNKVKLAIGYATASFGCGFYGTRPGWGKSQCPDWDPKSW